ncbi:protein nervous wreck [Caerostris extrusa]|uniref:Protein nervous wreck n=1 Tax=Caerostris extrusa TaxID=172846 RepID=A0AAV4MLB6_CAEEX|nr:protein nervous wreck [Caerostris extrusa]
MSVKMQPPPRKGKVTTALKNIHNEQLVKLQMKHQQDSDFLDDIRNFSKMRAVIERDYAQALLKLATSHLQKERIWDTVYGVWKTLLDETEKIAKARLAATEVYQQQVSEGAKSLRLYKLQVAKKFSFRREACDIQATKARNDYVLALIAANAHQTKFYENDLPELVQINKLSIEHNAALCLSKEARRWISCVAKEHPYTLQSDQIGPQAELEARIDELRQIIRKSQTSKKKAEARLEAMKEAGVNVEDWVKTSDTESVGASDSPADHFSRSGTVTSRSSRQSYQSSEVFEGSVEVNDAAFYDSDTTEPPTSAPAVVDTEPETPYMPDLTSAIDVVAAVQEAWDAAAEAEEIEEPEPVAAVQEPLVNGEVPASAPGQRCVALFSYEATNTDELSFVEQEELELINEGDGDGWVMARNYRGEEGYIPQNYVEVVEPQASESSSRPPLTSFSSVDYTMPSEDKEAGIDVESQPVSQPETVETNAEPVISELATTEIQRPTELPYDERVSCCQAIYDYEATCDEELSFYEVVEELKESGEPITPSTPMSPPDAPPPPAFTPPEAQLVIPPAAVILTQPTPEIEQAEGSEPQAVILNMDEDFHIELNKKPLSQPQEQLSASDTESSEHETAATDNPVNYAPLVSSPDSPTKTMVDGVKDTSNEAETKEEINSEITSPSVGTDDCPTVVITAITGGDTPVSDEEMEIKEESAIPEKKEEEKSPAAAPDVNPDAFECNFDDDFANKPAPEPSHDSQAAKTQASKEAESVKMDINGIDKTQSFTSDGNQDFFSGVAESSETTG